MKRNSIYSTGLLKFLVMLLVFSGVSTYAQINKPNNLNVDRRVLHQGLEANANGYYEGVIRIKLRPMASTRLDQMLSRKGNRKGEVTKTAEETYIVSGIESLDAVHQECNAYIMRRVFRPAGKFEDKHRKHGLHLWYEIQYQDLRDIEEILRAYRRAAEVEVAEMVHERKHYGYRVEAAMGILTDPPNDEFFELNQYSFNNTGQNIQGQVGIPGADVSIFEAWEIETGSSDIVVAITDGGIQVDHPDLVGNMWVNINEIPGNGIDDDNNGYIDDINGYGFGDGTPDIAADIHGSHVGGTVAAETNNVIGVAGIAGGQGSDDGVRLMSLAAFGAVGTGGFEDTYTYAADNGAVISQNSWGYTDAGVFDQVVLDAIDYFISEAGYDELGNPFGPMQGGLVIFAAGNDDADGLWYPGYYSPVLAVAGTDNQDGRYTFSNYGTWVDIAAPAVDIASTGDQSGYFYLTGTSMACPHVSGAAALILSYLSHNNASITPAELRSALIDNTDNIDATIPGFVGLLGSGRLNVAASLQSINLGPCSVSVPTGLSASNITGNSTDLSWDSQADATSYDYRYRTIGTSTWTTLNTTSSGVTLSGLDPLTNYEFQVSAICPDETSTFSGSTNFTTLDITLTCNDTPVVTVSNITESGAVISWSAMSGIDNFQYRYNLASGGNNTSGTTTELSIALTGLLSDTEYQFRIRANCTGGGTSPLASIFFTTTEPGGGICDIPDGLASSSITNTDAVISWNTVGSGDSYDYRYRVDGTTTWTDGNTSANSQALSGLSANTTYEYQVQAVCGADLSGYSGSSTFTTSEAVSCDIPDGLTASAISETSATISWNLVGSADSYDYRYRIDGTTTWTDGNTTSVSQALSGLTTVTTYEYQIQTVCGTDLSGYSGSSTFTTTEAVSCDIPDGLTASAISGTSATISWNLVGSADSYDYRHRIDGTTTWTDGNTTSVSQALSGLSAGTTYEYQVQAVCGTDLSGYSTSGLFTTTSGGFADCTDAPQNLAANSITTNSVVVSWDPVDPSDINFHQYRYRMVSGGSWTTSTTTDNSIDLSGLNTGTQYIFVIRNNCSVGGNSSTSTINFTTATTSSESEISLINGIVQVYPNPVQQHLTIVSSASVIVKLMTMNGYLVKESALDSESNQLDMGSMNKGIYLLQVICNGKSEVIRISKE